MAVSQVSWPVVARTITGRYTEDCYHFFGHRGSICWKILDKLQMKIVFEDLIRTIQHKRYEWYEAPSAGQQHQWIFLSKYDIYNSSNSMGGGDGGGFS